MELRSTSCNKQQSFNAHFFKRLFNQVMKFITLSSFGIFLFLPSLIWEKFGTEEYHFLFVIIYTALSQLVAYTGKWQTKGCFVYTWKTLFFVSVFCKCSKTWSIFVILCAYGIKIKASSLCKLIFGLYNLWTVFIVHFITLYYIVLHSYMQNIFVTEKEKFVKLTYVH